MERRVQQTCLVCGTDAGFSMADDGFFYCGFCNSQADDIVDTGVDEETLFNHYSGCIRTRTVKTNVIAAEPISQVKLSVSQYMDHPEGMGDALDGVGPTEPSDFGPSKKIITYEEYYAEVRTRYLTGIQVMIQLQCKALVEEFNLSPLIIGLIGPVWLRYLASTRILNDEWADRAVFDSEAQAKGGTEEFQPSAQYHEEPVNIRGKRLVYVWYSSLRSTIPISSTLAICFLLCHVAREAITPPDMLKWALEGKLPYFSAFSEIEKELGPPSEACPIRTSRMFRPIQLISSQKLESNAAKIGTKIGMELPLVNFHAVASRFLGSLSLPTDEILLMACRVFEWSSPPELYLSANEFRMPTRACVMSILIVALRIIFDINGYGVWESSLCSDLSSRDLDASGGDKSDTELSVVKLFGVLEADYDKLDSIHAYADDLQSYLQHCKDFVFSGLKPSYEDLEEEKLLKECWDFYLDNNNKDLVESDNLKSNSSGSSGPKRNRPKVVKKKKLGENTSTISKDEAIRRLKMDMDNSKFCYIPPRVNVKRKEYLHYARRRKDVYVYAVHADYYILLRSCAKVARVETRIMHIAVLSLERRLQWLEKRVDSLLSLKLNFSDNCDFCKDGESEQNILDDAVDLNE